MNDLRRFQEDPQPREYYYAADIVQVVHRLGWQRDIVILALIVVCAMFAAYLIVHQYDPPAVQVPIGAGERASMLAEIAQAHKRANDYKLAMLNYKAQIKTLNESISSDHARLSALQEHGAELDRMNREQAQRMSTSYGVVVEAKRVLGPLGLKTIQVVER